MPESAFEPRSAAQFQIKHALWAMLPASVLFAVLAPWLRSLQPDARNRVLIFWALSGVLTCGSIAFCLRKRLRLERQKGLPELVFYQPVPRWRRIVSALVIPAAVIYWGAASYAAATIGHNYSAQLLRAIYPSLIMGWLFQGLWLGRRRIEVFAEGFAMAGEQFIPWGVIYRFEWRQKSVPTLNMYCKWSVERTMYSQTIRVPAELVATFTNLLEARCPALRQPENTSHAAASRHVLTIQPSE